MSKKKFEYQSFLEIPPKYRLKSKPIEGGKVVVHKEHIPIGTNLEVQQFGSGTTSEGLAPEDVNVLNFPTQKITFKPEVFRKTSTNIEITMPVTLGVRYRHISQYVAGNVGYYMHLGSGVPLYDGRTWFEILKRLVFGQIDLGGFYPLQQAIVNDTEVQTLLNEPMFTGALTGSGNTGCGVPAGSNTPDKLISSAYATMDLDDGVRGYSWGSNTWFHNSYENLKNGDDYNPDGMANEEFLMWEYNFNTYASNHNTGILLKDMFLPIILYRRV